MDRCYIYLLIDLFTLNLTNIHFCLSLAKDEASQFYLNKIIEKKSYLSYIEKF